MKNTKTFTKVEFGRESKAEAYTTDEGKTWRWLSNDAPCPIDACRSYSIPCDFTMQQQLVSDHCKAVVDTYRRNHSNRKLTHEQQMEMRAAYGPGKKVVDLITGQRFTT